MARIHPDAFKFDADQVESLINKVVPILAEPEDHEFFRGVLHCRAEAAKSSGEFAYFIAKLLKVL